MKQHLTKKIKLQLVGLNSNAFALMGAFQGAARKQKAPPEEVKACLDDCISGDYDHLLATLSANCDDSEDEETEEA